ncbi:DNA repair protein RadA, partial [Citrobacter sp. AAK_AS5]
CSDCGTAFPKWAGQCTACQAWNTLVEDVDDPEPIAVPIPAAASVARPIGEYGAEIGGPRPTGIAELDRVLGVGIVPGSVVLVSGDPGIGKSTL